MTKDFDFGYNLGFVIVVLTFFLFLFTNIKIYDSSNHVTIYELNGDSMRPTINNSQTFLCNKKFDKIKVGDIIVYDKRKLDYIVAHRVIKKIDNTTFKTKGDNNNFPDSYLVNRNQIICKYFKN